jgi:hypothetical protein
MALVRKKYLTARLSPLALGGVRAHVMRARWLVLGLVLGAITIWALLTGFLNQHEIRGMLTLNDICFHGTSRFEGCLNNATLIPTFNGTVTAGNASCAPETTYDADGLFLNWTCIPIPPPTTVVQLNGSVIGPSNNNTLACTTVTAGTYGGADLVSLQVGCDGRIVNISNGGVALTATTQFNGDVTGVFNNLSLVTIPGLPANWSVGSSSCIPFLEGDNKGRIHYQACINLSVTALPNGTVFLSTPHETTIMNNGSAITFGTVQPIDVTSTPTFAGITINGAGEFNANGAPLAGLTLPTSAPVLLTGRAATSGVFGDYLFTPVLAFYNGANTPPTRVDQCRNVDDCLTMFDGYTSQVPFPTAFDWLGSTPGFTPYAIWKNSNALNFLAFTQPGSPSAQVTPIPMLAMTPAASAFLVPVTMAGTLIVSGATTLQSTLDVTSTLTAHGNAVVDGVLSLPNTPLYAIYGGTGSGATLAGNNVMISQAGANGGKIVEAPLLTQSIFQSATVSWTGGTHSISIVGLRMHRVSRLFVMLIHLTVNFGVVSLTIQGLGFPFNPSSSSTVNAPAGTIPTAFRPASQSCYFTYGTRGGLSSDVLLYFCVVPNGALAWGFVDSAGFNQLSAFLSGTIWSISPTVATYIANA